MELVTGGAGFLGSHVVDTLVTMGKGVRVLDNLSPRPNDSGRRLRDRVHKFGRSVEFVEGDVRDPRDVRRAVEGCNRVFHLAHFTGSRRSLSETSACLETNIQGTQNVLEAMSHEQIESFILCSHGHVYGEAGTRASTETDPTRPCTPFAASMVAAEALTTAWQAQNEAAVAIVRPFNVFGPRMRPDSAMYQFLTATENHREVSLFGRATARDYVYASPVVKALIQARRVRPGHHPSIFNVASGRSIQLTDLIQEIEIATGNKARPNIMPNQPGDVRRTLGDSSHTTRLLDIRTSDDLQDGLRKTLRWLRSQPSF